MATVTLTKWGNGQGVLIPKRICDQLGLRVGDKVTIDSDGRRIDITPQRQNFLRGRVVSIQTLFEGWEGTYVPPADWAGSGVGNEPDWGAPVGKEMW